MPKVSVIIPIYKVEQYLAKCLDSVINQTYKNLEIICVNDCSPDNCAKILENYANKDVRIKIVNRAQNGGLSAARNSGLDVATGEYIYFLDSDDWIDQNYIEKMVEAIEQSKAEVVLNTNIDTTNKMFLNRTFNNVSHEFINAKEAILNITWNTWAHLWKKSFLDRINARFPEGYIIEDQYFQAITFVHLDKVYVIRDSVYHYLIRNDSIVGQKRNDGFEINLRILNKIIDYYEEHNLLNLLGVRVITPWILPELNDRVRFQLLQKYFKRVEKMVSVNRKIYKKWELALFDDTLQNLDKAVSTNYRNMIVLEQLRSNVIKG